MSAGGESLPPKLPPLSENGFEPMISSEQNHMIKPEPSTVVPAAFNPVFWLSTDQSAQIVPEMLGPFGMQQRFDRSDPFRELLDVESESKAAVPITWNPNDQGSSAGSSSSNTTSTEVPISSMFETPTLMWRPSARSTDDHTSGATGGFSNSTEDGDTVMPPWCSSDHELVPAAASNSPSPPRVIIEESKSEPMNWQMHNHQDMYDPPDGLIAPMSPELQRMAAVLDQM